MLLLVISIANTYLGNKHYIFYCIPKQLYDFDVRINFWISAAIKRFFEDLLMKFLQKIIFYYHSEKTLKRNANITVTFKRRFDPFELQSKLFKAIELHKE